MRSLASTDAARLVLFEVEVDVTGSAEDTDADRFVRFFFPSAVTSVSDLFCSLLLALGI